MTFQEINDIIDNTGENFFNPFDVPTVEEVAGKLCLNDFIPLPIIVNNSYDKTSVIEVKDPTNEIIGYIHFSNNGAIIIAEDMSNQLFAAYLYDVNSDDFKARIDKKITKNYLVVKSDKLADYLSQYCESSGIWGGYIHEDLGIIPQPNIQTIRELYARPNLKLPTDWHKESMIRAIQQPFAFERFLKNYHLLELLFDWQTMKEIKEAYTNNDFNKAADFLRNYDKEDIKRIKYIITTRFKDINRIVDEINKVVSFPVIAKNMFYKYGKDSNPLKDEFHFDEILTKEDLFKVSSFTINNGRAIKLTVQPDYKTFIINLASYWIYRIRSSIAHSKIGEYQLSYRDEAFMVEFAEPLLQEVITQCFTIDEESGTGAEMHVEPEQSVNTTSNESIKVEPVKKN